MAGAVQRHFETDDPDTAAARWEWRVFGESLTLPETPRLAMKHAEPDDEEIYLLSTRSIQNVKLRRGAVDIKCLDAIDAGGLERWRPAGHFVFPLGPTEVAQIEEALGVVFPVRLGYPLDRSRLLRALATMEPDVTMVPVRKARTRFALAGCEGELVEISAHGRRLVSIALEDINPGYLGTAIRMLGVTDPTNLNYPRALKALVGIHDSHETTPAAEPLALAHTGVA